MRAQTKKLVLQKDSIKRLAAKQLTLVKGGDAGISALIPSCANC